MAGSSAKAATLSSSSNGLYVLTAVMVIGLIATQVNVVDMIQGRKFPAQMVTLSENGGLYVSAATQLSVTDIRKIGQGADFIASLTPDGQSVSMHLMFTSSGEPLLGELMKQSDDHDTSGHVLRKLIAQKTAKNGVAFVPNRLLQTTDRSYFLFVQTLHNDAVRIVGPENVEVARILSHASSSASSLGSPPQTDTDTAKPASSDAQPQTAPAPATTPTTTEAPSKTPETPKISNPNWATNPRPQIPPALYSENTKNYLKWDPPPGQGKTYPNFPVPRTIHQIYVGEDLAVIPAYVKDNITKLNPDWHYQLWTNEHAEAFLKEHTSERVQLAFQDAPWGTFKADLFRIVLMSMVGGIYADVDLEFVVPMTEIIEQAEGADFIGMISPEGIKPPCCLSIGFIATSSPEPFLQGWIEYGKPEKIAFGDPYGYNIDGMCAWLHSDAWIGPKNFAKDKKLTVRGDRSMYLFNEAYCSAKGTNAGGGKHTCGVFKGGKPWMRCNFWGYMTRYSSQQEKSAFEAMRKQRDANQKRRKAERKQRMMKRVQEYAEQDAKAASQAQQK